MKKGEEKRRKAKKEKGQIPSSPIYTNSLKNLAAMCLVVWPCKQHKLQMKNLKRARPWQRTANDNRDLETADHKRDEVVDSAKPWCFMHRRARGGL